MADMFELGLMAWRPRKSTAGRAEHSSSPFWRFEELAAADPSASVIVDVQNTLFNNAILRWGDEAQKRRWLPRSAKDTVASYALSEAGSGSDAFALTTRAVEDAGGDCYRLTGRKLWITNAAEAGLFLLFATVNPEPDIRASRRS